MIRLIISCILAIILGAYSTILFGADIKNKYHKIILALLFIGIYFVFFYTVEE